MRVKMLAAIFALGILGASIVNAAPSANDENATSDNFGSLQGPTLADNGGGNSTMSGTASMSGTNNMGDSAGSNMSGTPNNNMSGTPNNNMSGTGSPSDEGGADTATGDDY